MKKIQRVFPKISSPTITNNLHLIIPIVFLTILSIFMIYHGVFLSPDKFFIAVLILMLALGRAKEFLKDWSPPIMLFMSYEYLRGLVPEINKAPHIFPMIKIDEALFGYLPTVRLQELLFSPKTVHIYDYYATILYLSHFIVPLAICLYFWLKDKAVFRSYLQAVLVLSYLAYATYLIFPAMPPWLASQSGYIPPVQKIFDHTIAHFSYYINMPSIYNVIGVNLVAAVPSLHAAYPTLTMLFLYNRVGKFKPILVIYAVSMWFSVVYLGEHYVIDVILGVLYAVITYLLFKYKSVIFRPIAQFFKRTHRYAVVPAAKS
jgi:membrane-associated phospholipid phosphatase